MAKKVNPTSVDHSQKKDPKRLECGDGGCVWIMTDEGWEHFEACEENTECKCPSTPPTLQALVGTGDAFITVCEDNRKSRGGPILSMGFVTYRKGFKIDPRFKDDYCVSISEEPGKWRYGHRGVNRMRPQRTGHLDGSDMPRGVIRLDRLDSRGELSLELCAIGFLEPKWACDLTVQNELSKYKQRRFGLS